MLLKKTWLLVITTTILRTLTHCARLCIECLWFLTRTVFLHNFHESFSAHCSNAACKISSNNGLRINEILVGKLRKLSSEDRKCDERLLLDSSHLLRGLPSCLFPSSIPINILYSFLTSPMRATCKSHEDLLKARFIILKIS